LVEH